MESPINDLLTDIEQIASGIPSRPRYRAASMFLETVHTTPVDTLFEKAHYKKLVDDLSYMVSKYNELNTLGYVLKARGKMREAELAFALNMSIFEFEPNCWYAMGKHKYDLGENKEAKDLLTRVLDFYPESKNTKAMLEKIEERS